MTTPFVFGPAFQQDMLALALRDVAFAEKMTRYVSPEKLYSEAHQFLFQMIARKVTREHAVPSFVEAETQLRLVDRAKRRLLADFVAATYAHVPADPVYLRAQLTDYARRAQFVTVFSQAQVLWNSGRQPEAFKFTTDGMNELEEIDFTDEVPLKRGVFEDYRLQQVFESETIRRHVPTGIPPLDDILGGGLSKGELGLIVGEAKRGKSIGLVHMGAACLMMRAGTVAHFVLEGTAFQTMTRYQSRLSRLPHFRIKKDHLTDEERVRLAALDLKYRDRLIIEPMTSRWDYTVLDIQTRLRRLRRQGVEVDLVVVDYGDLLTTAQRMEKRFEQAEVFRGLKSLAMMENVALWSATQATKTKDEEQERLLRAANVAEAYEKARITDLLITLNQTARERMMGVLRFHIDLYRDNEADRTFLPIVDFSRMILYSHKFGFMDPSEIPDWGKSMGRSRK